MTAIPVPDHRSAAPLDRIDPSLATDSTAGLQRFLNSTPVGSVIELPFDLVVNGGIVLAGGRTLRSADPSVRARLLAPVAYPWRVGPDLRQTVNGATNPYYNPDGICAPWALDQTGSLSNPYCRTDANGNPNVNGGQYGGFDGTTGSGTTYDGLHLSCRVAAPFLPKHVNAPIRVLAYDGFNEIIKGISADGKTVTWLADPGALQESSTHNVAWAVHPNLGWRTVFLPNPAWSPRYFGGGNHPWGAYDEALRIATGYCQGRIIVDARDTSKVVNIEVVGANPTWGQMIARFDTSLPVVNEFQHGISVETGAVSSGCHSHHHYGDGFAGAGLVENFRAHHLGRMGMTGHFDNKIIRNGVIDLAHRASIDIESGHATHGLQVRNVALGGHGISATTAMVDCVFDGLHSTQADVDAGTISVLSLFLRGAFHGAFGSSNVTYSNNVFDQATPNFLIARLIDGLHVHANRARLSGYFVQPYKQGSTDRCTNVDISGNDGGPGCDGQVAP